MNCWPFWAKIWFLAFLWYVWSLATKVDSGNHKGTTFDLKLLNWIEFLEPLFLEMPTFLWLTHCTANVFSKILFVSKYITVKPLYNCTSTVVEMIWFPFMIQLGKEHNSLCSSVVNLAKYQIKSEWIYEVIHFSNSKIFREIWKIDDFINSFWLYLTFNMIYCDLKTGDPKRSQFNFLFSF